MRITRNVYENIIEHARTDSPIEACGYLAEKDGVVAAFYRLRNTDCSAEHFSLDPGEQFATVRSIRSEGMKLAAVYHSHPASPARPSPEDIRLAYDPGLSYVIVSLVDTVPVVKSFRITGGSVIEEEVHITEQMP